MLESLHHMMLLSLRQSSHRVLSYMACKYMFWLGRRIKQVYGTGNMFEKWSWHLDASRDTDNSVLSFLNKDAVNQVVNSAANSRHIQ